MPEGKYYRRGHWVKKSTPKKVKGSGWVVAAGLAALAWFWIQGSIEQQSAPPQPAPSVSESAAPTQVGDADSAQDPPMPSEPPLPSEGP